MDTQSTFDFDEPKQASAMNETEIDAIDADAGNVPDPKNIDDISSSGESQKSDGAEIAAPDPQGSNEPDGEAIGANEQVSIRRRQYLRPRASPVQMSDEASAFPETSHRPSRDIEARDGGGNHGGRRPTEGRGKRRTRMQSCRCRAHVPAPPPQVSIRTETASIFEATGLTGHFELSDEASAFPETSHEGLLALARDIEATGMVEEITVAGDPPKVVDGKRRLRACKVAGVEPTYRLLRQDIDPRAYVWAKNAERRDLSTSQKAQLLYQKLNQSQGEMRI